MVADGDILWFICNLLVGILFKDLLPCITVCYSVMHFIEGRQPKCPFFYHLDDQLVPILLRRQLLSFFSRITMNLYISTCLMVSTNCNYYSYLKLKLSHLWPVGASLGWLPSGLYVTWWTLLPYCQMWQKYQDCLAYFCAGSGINQLSEKLWFLLVGNGVSEAQSAC